MIDTILALNAGSSSVKFSLFLRDQDLPLLAHGEATDLGNVPLLRITEKGLPPSQQNLPPNATQEDALRTIFKWIQSHESGWRITIVAHRIVHGGADFLGPTRVTADVIHRLKKLIPLAPLHQPHNLAALGISEEALPQVPQIACFDTAFHAGHDPLFSLYALPQELTDQGVKRYGFHGLSYAWIAEVLKREHPDLVKSRVIAAHLGNGSSLCAIKEGRSIDTTMGMTALDGLAMGSRSGSIDPGAVIYMMRDLGFSADDLLHILYEKSGVKGLSDLTNDMKALLASDDPKAKFACDYYALRAAQFMAMMAVSMGGVDAIVFTGGIGENAKTVRDKILSHVAFLGSPRVLIIPANEERIMAMEALSLVA